MNYAKNYLCRETIWSITPIMLTENFIPRSLLFNSALKYEAFYKTLEYEADVKVIDLEASVPESNKETARAHLKTFLAQKHAWITAVRINSIYSLNGIIDIQTILSCRHKPGIIILPMLKSSEEINIVKTILNSSAYQPLIYGIIETPQGLKQINSIAACCNGLIFGSADYAAALGVTIGEWDNMLHIRQQIVAECALFGIPAFDTACFHLNNIEKLSLECKRSRQLGFKGKAAIHPQQVVIINQIFSPTSSEITLAEQILNNLDTTIGIAKLDSMMIGPPFIIYAKKIISRMNELLIKDKNYATDNTST